MKVTLTTKEILAILYALDSQWYFPKKKDYIASVKKRTGVDHYYPWERFSLYYNLRKRLWELLEYSQKEAK